MGEKKIKNTVGPDLRALRKACGVGRSNMAYPLGGLCLQSILAIERQARGCSEGEACNIVLWLRDSCGDVVDQAASILELGQHVKDLVEYTGRYYGRESWTDIKTGWENLNRKYNA